MVDSGIREEGSAKYGGAELLSESRGLNGPTLILALRKLLAPLVVGLGLFAAWELMHRLEVFPSLVFPSPVSVVDEAWQQAFGGVMWRHVWVTLQEALAGFVIASASGILFGIAIGLSSWVARALYPYLILIQSMPRIALAPVFIAMFGFGITTKIVTAVTLAFFPPLINTILGLREVDQDAVTLMRSLNASKPQIFRKLLWPSALPAVLGGTKTALTLAFTGVFVAELVAANEGVGVLMELAAYELRTSALFAYLIWFSVISVGFFGLLELLDRKLVFWRKEVREDVFGERVE